MLIDYRAFTQHLKPLILWGIRLWLLWMIVTILAPVSHRLLPEPHQMVITQEPHVCVHTDLVNEVDEWKIRHTLQLVREMGATTVVEFFPWAYVEGEKDHYNWYQSDRIIENADQQGLEVIARLGLVPGWARPEIPELTTLNHISDEAVTDFAEYAADFSRRYTGKVKKIIIWNEPNLAFEWGYQDFSAARYSEMLRIMYPIIKAANQEIEVLAGALAPTLEPEGSPHGLNDVLYLRQMLEAGAANYFDALAMHTYGFGEPPGSPPEPGKLNFRRAEYLYDLMVEFNAQDKPIYITESGWNDNPRWTLGVRPSQRIAYTLDALRMTDEMWDWAQLTCLWLFRYTRPNGNYRDNFTLVTPEFQIKPIYYAIQNYALGREVEETLWLPAPGS